MLITRNNYETFFLLYADDELRADERLAVERFLAENEDLRGELNMILAAVLPTDEFSFDIKDSLYKNSFVDGSLQEGLLLKLDNELSAKELKEFNKSIASNPSAVKEEQLLSAAKLDATEIITCPQKELLYKKEREPVVSFRMLRWAAAAILIDNVAVIKQNINPANNQNKNNIIVTEPNIAFNSNLSIKKEGIKQVQKKPTTIIAVSNKKAITNSVIQISEEVITKELAAKNEVQKTTTQTDIISQKTVNEIQSPSLAKAEKAEVAALTNDNIAPLETSYVQASFTDTEANNNKILYMDEEEVKRSKVGTVFRQFKRVIERTAKIKTGNPIRIAGFQIGAD